MSHSYMNDYNITRLVFSTRLTVKTTCHDILCIKPNLPQATWRLIYLLSNFLSDSHINSESKIGLSLTGITSVSKTAPFKLASIKIPSLCPTLKWPKPRPVKKKYYTSITIKNVLSFCLEGCISHNINNKVWA